MTSRVPSIAAAVLTLVAPVLAFPALAGSSGLGAVGVLAAVAMICAIGLVRNVGRLPLYVAVLAVAAIFAALDVAEQPETINHFAGLALGLLAMGTVGVWCRTRERLVCAVLAFVVFGAAAAAIGFRSVLPVHTAKTMFGKPTAPVSAPAPLPIGRLHPQRSVNRNALAALAIMVVPVAVALAGSPLVGSSVRIPLQVAGVLSALGTIAVVVVMQSRSVWLAAAGMVWLMARRFVKPAVWWATAIAVFVLVPVVVYTLWGDHPRAAEPMGSLQTRIAIWQQALEALRTSPWTGIGFDYFRHSGYSPVLVYPDIIVGRPHAHNVFLQTALDVGLIGLAAYMAVTVFVLRRAYDLARLNGGDSWVRAVGVAAGLSVFSVQVYGLLDAVALGAKVGIFQWLACGLVLAAWRLQTSFEQT